MLDWHSCQIYYPLEIKLLLLLSLGLCFVCSMCVAKLFFNWARSCENVSYAICEQQRCRSACASAQSDQHLCCRCSA